MNLEELTLTVVPQSTNNYNRIESPGKKYRKQDGN